MSIGSLVIGLAFRATVLVAVYKSPFSLHITNKRFSLAAELEENDRAGSIPCDVIRGRAFHRFFPMNRLVFHPFSISCDGFETKS